jgi:hypothetical protein
VQLAEIGALDTPQPDPCCCCAQQRAVVTEGLSAVPMILALDGIQPDCAVIGHLYYAFDRKRINTPAPVVIDICKRSPSWSLANGMRIAC